VTLCIAAECRGHVIVGSDFRGEDDYTSAENQNKLEWIEDTWPVLIAGTVSRAHDLVAALNREFAEARKKSTAIDDKNVQVILRRAIRKQKYQLADEIVSRELGIQYAVFLKNGKGFLSEKSFEEIEGEVRKVDLGCELIVVFFHDRRSYIYRISSDLSVGRADNFCCIGSGETLANSDLSYREHDADQILRTSLYRVFEAHQLAKRAPGVGENFAISVFSQEKGGQVVWKRLNDSGLAALDRNFTRFGPKKIRGVRLDINSDLEEFERTDIPKTPKAT
jgi:20S proteasome alpha/beta subunit